MRRLLRAVVFFLAALVSIPAAAQNWTPFPSLAPGSHLAVQPSLDGSRWDGARECLRTMRSDVGASYYGAVVAVTDEAGRASPSANDAVPYVDALAEAWHRRLDPEKHVLIVLGLDNRAVAIHPGQKWVGIGFERHRITSTIDNSAFKGFARSGDYSRAICNLADAVDDRLGQLETRARQKGRAAAVEIESLQADLERTAAILQVAMSLDPQLHEWVNGRLTLSADRTDAAAAALQRQPLQAAAYAEDARDAFDRAVQAIDRLREYDSKMSTWLSELDALRDRVEARPDKPWFDTDEQLAYLESCKRNIEEGRVRLATGGVTHEHDCVRAIERDLRSEDEVDFIMTRVLPGIIAAVVLLALLFLFIVAVMRRRRVERLVEAELAAWSDALATASDRLLDLEREFSLYFDSGRQAWTGESAELDQACADEVNRLFLMFAKATDIHDDAARAAEAAPELRSAPLEDVIERLKSATVTIETGELETRRRIFLPLSRSYEVTATQLLDDLSGSYERVVELLEEATGLIGDVDDLRAKLSRCSSDLVAEIEERSESGLPVQHLLEMQDDADDRRRRGREIAYSDPRTALLLLSDAFERLVETRRVAKLGNEVLQHVHAELKERRAGLRGRIRTMREQGWKVGEPGFDPDHRLDRAVRVAQRITDRVATGEEDRAHEIWLELDEDLDELGRQLEATKDAREGVPPRLEDLRSRHAAIEDRIPKAKEALKQLARKHAEIAFEREADNLIEFAEVRSQILAGFASAEEAHEEQRYLAALEDIETLENALDVADRLIVELHDALRRLEEAKFLTGDRFAEAMADFDAIEELRRDALGVDPELSAEIAELGAALAALDDAMSAPAPHWLRLGGRASGLATLAADLREETADEIQKHRRAVARHAELASQGEDLLHRVVEEKRDRPHVEEFVRDAIEAVVRVQPLLDDPTVGGTYLTAAVRDAADWIHRAEAEWKSELEAIQKAEAELAAAQARYRQIDGVSYGHGVYANCADVEPLLARARAAANAREWEAVVNFAATSILKINAESSRAEAAADRKRRAARRAARSYSSSSSGSSSSSTTSFSSGNSFSSSSWSSSSSSSGGSSFGSSSGGSSW